MKTVFAVLFSLSVFGHATEAFGYGAIAYSTTTYRWGTSWNQLSQWDAEAVARANCGAYDCQTAVWVVNGCAALSTGTFRPWLFGYAWGSTRWEAQSLANAYCSRTDIGCRTITSICTL